jgi:hypothetical protein
MAEFSSAFKDATSSIPGYDIIAQILLQSYGVDAGTLVFKYIILYAIYKVVLWLWDKVGDFLQYVHRSVRLCPKALTPLTETTLPQSSRSTISIVYGPN